MKGVRQQRDRSALDRLAQTQMPPPGRGTRYGSAVDQFYATGGTVLSKAKKTKTTTKKTKRRRG